MKCVTLGFAAWLMMLLPLSWPAGVFAADDFTDFDDEDLAEELTAEPIEWRPVLTHFYVRSRYANDVPKPLHFAEQKGVLPSLIAAWEDLAPRVRIRGDESFGKSFGDNEPVISGWRRNKDANGFEVHAGRLGPTDLDKRPDDNEGADPADAPAGNAPPAPVDPMKQHVHVLLAAQESYIHVGLDVIMNVEDPSQRDEILDQFFKLDRMVFTVHHISDDPAGFLGVPDKEMLGRGGIDRSDRWPDVKDQANDMSAVIPVRVRPGCYAIRIKAAVSGRVDASEDFGPAKEVEAEIRVSFVGQSINIGKLSWDTEKKAKPNKTP